MGFAPAACVVVTVSVPQDAPLHPPPDNPQEKFALGCDPGTGVMVATIALLTPGARLPGAAICSVKLLVTVTLAELCREGSAALAAVMLTIAAPGRICGAV
jgi:hypothetical protein